MLMLMSDGCKSRARPAAFSPMRSGSAALALALVSWPMPFSRAELSMIPIVLGVVYILPAARLRQL